MSLLSLMKDRVWCEGLVFIQSLWAKHDKYYKWTDVGTVGLEEGSGTQEYIYVQ